MDISEKVKELIGKIKNVKSQNRLPGNCFFLDNDEIACFPRAFGDSRFPYSRDGKRRFFINGKEAECFYDEKLKTQSIYFDNEEIQGKPNIIIKVC